MQYKLYKAAIFGMWEDIRQPDFTNEIIQEDEGEEYASCGLCNPMFSAFQGRDESQPCPFDLRAEKAINEKPCMDTCQIFTKELADHKLKIVMSKFMTKFVTKEGIESLKSLAKACRGQKGTSKDASTDFVAIAEKVISSTDRFGGFEFSIIDGVLGAKRREE